MSDTNFEEAKAKLLENIDMFAADLRAKIEAVDSLETIENQSTEVKRISDEMMKDVTGGIVNTGVEYTPYTGGGLPEGKDNSWAHLQNTLIMKQNCAQAAYNARKFFESKFVEIDNYYEERYWPVNSGK